jgi:hypothetical protein
VPELALPAALRRLLLYCPVTVEPVVLPTDSQSAQLSTKLMYSRY